MRDLLRNLPITATTLSFASYVIAIILTDNILAFLAPLILFPLFVLAGAIGYFLKLKSPLKLIAVLGSNISAIFISWIINGNIDYLNKNFCGGGWAGPVHPCPNVVSFMFSAIALLLLGQVLGVARINITLKHRK